jgi:predicted alpha/beta-hydrolase family hydrolase
LGYPLHPPGKPQQLRTKHLPDIRVPVFVVQGSRDPFGDPAQIRAHMKVIPADVALLAIEDGDHSFKVPKRVASADSVMTKVVDGIVGFFDRVASVTPAM